MKPKLILPLLAFSALAFTGCTSMPKVMKELAKDPAAFKMQVTTIYGTINLSRAGSNTNSVKITSEGEIINNPVAANVATSSDATLIRLIELIRQASPQSTNGPAR